jgi:2-polyprenyl-6-methoxyphenol hydroxylase and related FAD-dependent oxidoreductases
VDYHGILLDEAIRLGAILQLGAEVEDIHTEQPAVLLAGGRCISADVVIGADGTSIDIWLVTFWTVSSDKRRPNVYDQKGCPWISSFSSPYRRHGLSSNLFTRAAGGLG